VEDGWLAEVFGVVDAGAGAGLGAFVEYGRFGAGLTLAEIVSRRAAGARSSTRRSEDALSRTGWAGAGAGAGAAGSTGAGMTATDVSPGAAALDVGGGTVAGAGSAEVSRVARYPPAAVAATHAAPTAEMTSILGDITFNQ